ncbi:MAG: hypothetical protein IPM29_32110 [Planctomycetes bacterium]|nr:hypothetical protein [Planctomycetota bacterium]
MTATSIAPNVAPPIDELAPGLVTRAREGDLSGSMRILIGLGVLGLGASLIGVLAGEEVRGQALFSYLVAYMFTLGIALGSLFFVMLQHITRAGWSVVVRRIAENMMALLWPWIPILFLPLAIGYHDVWHHWAAAVTDPTAAGYDHLLAGKASYLNAEFFLVRAAIYFAVWALLSRFFRNSSLAQDQNGDPGLSMRMARRASIGLLLFALSVTFAAFDWIMSLDPHWYSTIFGIVYFAGGVMAFFATLALLAMWIQRRGYLRNAISQEHYHDVGKLLFAFMVFWTYVSFSQYMLIWYANIPEETVWYAHRANTHWDHGVTVPWGYVGATLAIGHFMVPFAFLMSRHMKRNRLTLAIAAVFLLVMHWFDMQYLIMPNLESADHVHHHGMSLSWLDATTMVGMVALFLGLTVRNIASTPLIPERDPRLAESLRFHNI